MLLLLAVAVTTCGRRHHIKKGTGLLVGDSEDDIRDNVFNYDEQGGGEEDEVRLHDLHKTSQEKSFIELSGRLSFVSTRSRV